MHSEATARPFCPAVGEPAENGRPFAVPAKNPHIQALIHREIQAAAAHAWGRLLDVGCGTKPYARYFAPYVRQYVGMDVPDPLYEANRRGANVSVEVYGDAESMAFADGSFDTVVSFQVLEHLRHPWRFFAEAARVLSPGGVLIVTAPQQYHEHDVPNDYFRYTRFGLSSLARDAALTPLVLRPIGGGMLMIGRAMSYWWADKYWRTRGRPWLRGLLLGLTHRLAAVAERLFPWPGNAANWLMVARKAPPAPAGKPGELLP